MPGHWKILHENRQLTRKANHMEIFHNPMLPCCVIGFFEVKKDSPKVLLFEEGIPYEGLHEN